MLRRKTSWLGALLSRHWPEAETVLDLDRASLLNMIAEYGDPYSLQQQRLAAGQIMRRHGGHFLEEAVIEALLDSAAKTLGVPCTAGERAYLQCLARELLRTRAGIHEVERRLQAQVACDPVMQGMADTVGATTSLALNATLGSPLDLPQREALPQSPGAEPEGAQQRHTPRPTAHHQTRPAPGA